MSRILIALLGVLLLAGCGDPAEKLYETARFEERQFNRDHAGELYRQIVERYPASPFAAKARERLGQMEE